MLCVTGQEGSSTDPCRSSRICVWDLVHRTLMREIHGLAGRVMHLDISPDSRFLIAVGANHMLIVYDLAAGETVAQKRIEISENTECVFARTSESKDDNSLYLFALISDKTILKFTLSFDIKALSYIVSPPTVIKSIPGLVRRPFRSIALNDGSVLIANQSGDISHYHLVRDQFLGTLTFPGAVIDLDLHKAGQLLVLCYQSSTQKSTIHRFNIADRILSSVTVPEDDIVSVRSSSYGETFLYMTRDGRLMSSSSPGSPPIITMMVSKAVGLQTTYNKDGTDPILVVNCGNSFEVWSIDTDMFVRKYRTNFLKQKFGNCTTFSSRYDENSIITVCGFESGAIQVYSNSDLRSTLEQAHRGPVGSVAIASKYFVSGGSQDSNVRIWSLSKKTPQLMTQCSGQSSGAISSIRIDESDERKFFYANNRREIFGFDLVTEKIFMKKLLGDIVDMRIGRISATGQYTDTVVIATHKGGQTCVWDPDFAEPVAAATHSDHPGTSATTTCFALTQQVDPTALVGDKDGKFNIYKIGKKIEKISQINHSIISENSSKLIACEIIEMEDQKTFCVCLDNLGTIYLSLLPSL